jgi:hypothetical protein
MTFDLAGWPQPRVVLLFATAVRLEGIFDEEGLKKQATELKAVGQVL